MSRTLDQGLHHARWSEPILRKRYSPHLTPTSEEETSSVRRSRSSSPLPTMSHPRASPLDPPLVGCCSCRRRCSGKKTSKSHSANDSKRTNGVRDGLQRMRESLELQLISTQVEEALAGDRQAALIQHLDLATAALEALTQHARSLQVSHVAACRVLDLTSRLILYHVPASHRSSTSAKLITHLQQTEARKENRLLILRNVTESCSKNLAVSKQLQSIMDDHRIRKEDFYMAAKNFKNLLDNTELRLSQLEKLRRQYDVILREYRQSRQAVDVELPKIVRTRLAALYQGFQTIAEFYDDLEYNKQTANMFRTLGDRLCQDEPPKAADLLYDQAQAQEMCQKCKVNKIEKE